MIKRATWFLGGAVTGAAGAGYAKRKVKQTAAQFAPTQVVKSAVAKVRGKGRDVAEALRDGRRAMNSREAELKARLAAPVAPDGPAGTNQDAPHGRPPGDVAELDEVHERRALGPRRSRRRARRDG